MKSQNIFDLIKPVHFILRIIGIIPFKLNIKLKTLEKDTLYSNASILVVIMFCIMISYYHVFVMPVLTDIIFLRSAAIFYLSSRTLNVIIVVYTTRKNKTELMKLFQNVMAMNEYKKLHFIKETINYKWLKWFAVAIIYASVFIRFSHTSVISSINGEFNTATWFYNCTYIVTELYTSSVRLLYFIFLMLFCDYYKIINENLSSLKMSKDNILFDSRYINILTNFHQQICYSKGLFNKVSSELVLFQLGEYFWILVIYTYILVSKVYGSFQTSEWYINTENCIYWIFDTIYVCMVLIYPANLCASYVSYNFIIVKRKHVLNGFFYRQRE